MSFTSLEISDFRINLMFELLSEAQQRILPQIPSRRLRSALQLRIPNSSGGRKGDLFLPHFWAVIVHDGRRGFGPKGAEFLVYFVNADDDPRAPTPQRAANQRKLTRAEFQAGLARNDALQKLNPGGGPFQHMIIVKTPAGDPARVGPAQGSFFFTTGAAKVFEQRADDIIFHEFDKFIQENIIVEEVLITGDLGRLG